MAVYAAVIVIVSIIEIRHMKKEGLKKEIVIFIPLAIAAIVLAWLYAFHSEESIAGYVLKSLGLS